MFENPGQVWASAKGPAGQILRAGRETGADAPLFLPWRMAPTGGDFASMTGETMLSFASSNMRPGAKRSLNARLRRMIPNWPGLDDPAAVDAFRAAPDSVRKAAKNMMDVEFRDRGGLNIGEARLAVADPAQVSARDAGIQSVGRIDVASDLAPSTHPSYPYGVPGEGVGRIDADVGVYELLPDLAAERGVPDPLNPRPTDIRALQMGAKRGVITEDILRKLQARGVNVADLSGPALVAAAVGAGLLAPQEAEAGVASGVARQLRRTVADASDTFGPGAREITLTDPESGGRIKLLARPDQPNSVLGLYVDEEFRGRGIGRALQDAALAEGDLVGQVSSKAAAVNAYRSGRRPQGQPDATLDDVLKAIDRDSSVNMVTPGAMRSAGFARPGAMAATGAAGALASFLDMRSGKQDTPYKRFIAEGQRAVEQAIGAGENIGNLAASILAEPIAGYAGLVAGPEAVQRTRDYFAPQSMSPAAQQQMIGLGNTLESAGQQIMSGLDVAGQAVGVDRLSDYARYAPGYWEQRVVPALQRQFGTRAGSALAATLRAAPEAL
jgi:GNAT superfamily N-acetyltransferase